MNTQEQIEMLRKEAADLRASVALGMGESDPALGVTRYEYLDRARACEAEADRLEAEE